MFQERVIAVVNATKGTVSVSIGKWSTGFVETL